MKADWPEADDEEEDTLNDLVACTDCGYQFIRTMASIRIHADRGGNTTKTAVCPTCLSPKHKKVANEEDDE